MKPTLLYYLNGGRRLPSGKRFGMYILSANKWRILHDYGDEQ
jgi:hypothetical protein